jgi:hypothetical protein
MNAKRPPEEQGYDQWLQRDDVDTVAAMCRFFMKDDPVHQTLRKIADKLDELRRGRRNGIGRAPLCASNS